ncbi:hypothetical protein Tco_0435368 [Tanacetum coccineum]
MSKLAFCDYHNMVAILEKTEHNTDFHQIVDFLEASPLRYALLVRPTIYVSHIRQFWSTARIETADGETHIIAKINGPFSVQVTPSSFWQIFHPQVVGNIMKHISDRCKRPVTELIEFIRKHQPVEGLPPALSNNNASVSKHPGKLHSGRRVTSLS